MFRMEVKILLQEMGELRNDACGRWHMNFM
jgi:hypothetical protein